MSRSVGSLALGTPWPPLSGGADSDQRPTGAERLCVSVLCGFGIFRRDAAKSEGGR